MEIVSEALHRCLAYVVLVCESGYAPTEAELEQFSQQPGRLAAVTTIGHPAPARPAVHAVEVPAGETVATAFVRLGWAEWTDDRLRVTPLGLAVDRGLRRRAAELPDGTDVLIDRDDPALGASVLRRIAAVGSGLLVDPYFSFQHVVPVLRHTQITRVLTSERISVADRASLEIALDAVTPDRPFEVRIGDRALHDRNVVGDDRSVLSIGVSLDGLGAVNSVVVPIHDGAAAIAEHVEAAWRTATPVALSADLPPPEPVDAELAS
ncbi:MAG: hypothetical protein AAF945_09350 [Actinomycetota bacterium]